MSNRYISKSQQRILRILVFLGGHEVRGLAPGEIARSLQILPANVTHDLANLREAGLAEPLPDTNRWRLTPRLPQIALAMLNRISSAKHRIQEVEQRYTRDPH